MTVLATYGKSADIALSGIEAPVIGNVHFNTAVIRRIFIFANNFRIVQQQIAFQHIGIAHHILNQIGTGNIIGFVKQRILNEFDFRIFVQEYVKLLSQIAAHNCDILDPCSHDSIQQGFYDALSMYQNKRLGCIQGDRNHAGSKAGRKKDRLLHAIGLQYLVALEGNIVHRAASGFDHLAVLQLRQGFIDDTERKIQLFCQSSLGAFVVLMALDIHKGFKLI